MAPARAMQTCRELTLRSTSNGPRTASRATAAPARHNASHGPASLTHFFARCLVLSLIKIELLRGSLFGYMPPRQSRAAGQVSHVVRTQLKAPAQKTARRRIRITCGAPKMIRFPPSPTDQLSWCRLTERKEPAASRAVAMSLDIGNRRAPNALSPKLTH